MNIVQIVLMGCKPHFMDGVFILFTNNFVTILGVVFATVWTSKQNWALRRMLESPQFFDESDQAVSTIRFQQAKSWTSTSSLYDTDDELGFSWPTVSR